MNTSLSKTIELLFPQNIFTANHLLCFIFGKIFRTHPQQMKLAGHFSGFFLYEEMCLCLDREGQGGHVCAGIQLYLRPERPGPLSARWIQSLQLVHHVP